MLGAHVTSFFSFSNLEHRIALLSFFPFISWFLLVIFKSGTFQNTHGSDPLAAINVLYPFYWIILSFFILIFVYVIYRDCDSPFLHVLLLCEISLVLFFTPFVLSGFSWSPDSLFHGGVASYMPQILNGANIPFSDYPQAYPLSYLLTYSLQNLFRLNIIQYTLYVYPALSSILISVLGYFFVAKVINPKNAFLTMIVTLSALHYLEPHVSPFSTGTILILFALISLTMKSRIAKVLFVISVLALVLTHPISPLSLGVFLFYVLVVKFLSTKLFGLSLDLGFFSKIASNISFTSVFLTMAVWFTWTLNYSYQAYGSVGYSIARILSLEFLNVVDEATQFTVGGFIYPEIFQINLIVYAIFAIFSLFFVLRSFKNILQKSTSTFTLLEFFFSSLALIYAAYSYLLYLGSGEHVILGRGLIFFVLMASLPISMFLLNKSNNFRVKQMKLLFSVLLLTGLFFSFPIVSYSKEAYNTYTPSQAAGLEFMADNLNLSMGTVSLSADQQLASYVNLNDGLSLIKYPPDLDSIQPDYVVLRVNYYLARAMRYELDFENNTHTQLVTELSNNPDYTKIYSNGEFEVYAKSN